MSGAKNFRDFGGYVTAGGGRVKRGVLYRSDRLSELSEDDFKQLSPLGIRSICDLRGREERRSAPTRWGCETVPNILHMPLIRDGGQSILQRMSARTGLRRDPQAAREVMFGLYERLVTEEQALAYYRRLFELIADENGLPVLIHCSGGKDRTGVTCALILGSLGVDMADIVADFMMSRVLFSDRIDFSALPPQILEYFSIGDLHTESLRTVCGVEPEYIEAVFNHVDEKYGTMDAFLRGALGLTADIIALVRRNLIETKVNFELMNKLQ